MEDQSETAWGEELKLTKHGPLPKFEVSELSPPETFHAWGIVMLFKHLLRFEPEKFRASLMWQDWGYEDELLDENLSFSLRLATNPHDLAFHVGEDFFFDMVVRLQPELFDRTNPTHEAVFQKCLAILDVLCEAPYEPVEHFDIQISVGFYLDKPLNDAQAAAWKEVRERWRATAQRS